MLSNQTRHSARKSLTIESLERRQLFSVDVNLLPNGELLIETDMPYTDVRISDVSCDFGVECIQVTNHLPLYGEIDRYEVNKDLVTSIRFEGSKYDDKFTNDTSIPSEIHGRLGNDTIYGGYGDDIISGGYGIDIIYAREGDDSVSGNRGIDFIYGGAGSDTLYGGWGTDHIWGGADVDYIYGEKDVDFLFGDQGNDVIDGGQGDDIILGGIGDDTLGGAGGTDTIYGGFGDDQLWGGPGEDKLYGDEGTDTYHLRDGEIDEFQLERDVDTQIAFDVDDYSDIDPYDGGTLEPPPSPVR